MLRLLALITIALTFADHWTTYLCLRKPVDGWEVVEANPIAEWLFGAAGLLPGLLIDTAVTLVAVTFLVSTARFAKPTKLVVFSMIAGITGYAVANNLRAISELGLSPLGIG